MDRLSRFIATGKSIEYGGKKAQARPHVKESESVNSRIRRYIVESSGREIEVLIWTDKNSSIIAAVDQYGLTNNAAVNAAKDAYYSETAEDSPLSGMSRSLPDAVYRRLVNDSEYGMIQNDRSEIQPMIDDLSERIERYAETAADILSAYDDAINACNGYTRHDLSLVSEMLAESAEKYERYLSEITPDEFTGIICRRDNDLSRTWLLKPPFTISDEQASSAFLSLVSEKNLSDRDMTVMDMLLDRIEDIGGLAERMIRGTDYYCAERMIIREKRRDHICLAKELAERIDRTADIRSHLREAALVRRDLGIPDTGEYFIKSFIEEPNGKRLIDVKVAHPMADTNDIITKAWRKHGKEPQYMCFFAENGLSANVARWLNKRSDDDIRQDIAENPDEYEHLCLILLRTCTYDTALRVALLMLEYRIGRYVDDDIVNMIEICDRIVDAAGRPEHMTDTCRSFRNANNPRKSYWRRSDWTAF